MEIERKFLISHENLPADLEQYPFHKIQQEAYSAIVFYGQETGSRSGKTFDELGVLLPIKQFESKMLRHIGVIDGLVLSCREEMIRTAGADSLDL